MSHGHPIPLTPVPIGIRSEEFQGILGWPFTDAYVGRLLLNDIPQRVQFGNCQIWIYRDPEERLAGFGTLDVCDDCCEFTDGHHHPYIPLLAVNPTIKSRGYGTSIVRHLVDESALLALQGHCHDVLFLDVYISNLKAIDVYTKCG
ncbi:MAG TPA: GNAT family N-acetyltransferase, partial [Pirellulales bacterium]|nr:GNAT family N-acetyltransferase [Pirellulales bacterium]